MHVTNRNARLFVPLLLILTALISSAGPKGPKLRLAGYAPVWGGSCQPGRKLVAGSRFFLTVHNTADEPRRELVPGWPGGYILEAELDPPGNQPYVATPGLIERMGPTRILSAINRASEKLMQMDPARFGDEDLLNAKDFVVTIPRELAGHTVVFRARYEGNGLSLTSEAITSIRIVAPCDESDSARIVGSFLYEAWNVGKGGRVIELADSMLACGLSDAMAWDTAERVAIGMNLYDKALAYVERMYEDFGVLGAQLFTNDPPPLDRGGVRSPSLQASYERIRSKYLRLKAEFEQQQR